MVAHGTRVLPLSRWVVLCAAAEAIGMTAAATAATAAQAIAGEGAERAAVLAGLGIVVAGGLVEGIAVGGLQARGLARLWPRLPARRWLLVTTAVAGLGWAAASAPAALSGGGDGSSPPVLLVLAGALALGAAMGALLGAAQAAVLRGVVRHPWRWVTASSAAWAPAMAVIFFGATVPGTDTPVLAVAALGTLTGALAGAVLGLVSGAFLPSLEGPPVRDRVVRAVLASSAHPALDRSLVVLRVRGVRTGKDLELPVQYATTPDGLVVLPGHAEAKTWWRNLRQPAPVEALMSGEWHTGVGVVLLPGDPRYTAVLSSYQRRWPRAGIPNGAPVVAVQWTGSSEIRRAGGVPASTTP
jgi:hypothetical protein